MGPGMSEVGAADPTRRTSGLAAALRELRPGERVAVQRLKASTPTAVERARGAGARFSSLRAAGWTHIWREEDGASHPRRVTRPASGRGVAGLLESMWAGEELLALGPMIGLKAALRVLAQTGAVYGTERRGRGTLIWRSQ